MVNSDKLFQSSQSPLSPKATLSPGQPELLKTVVASPILSVTVEGANISNLVNPVVFAFPINQVNINIAILINAGIDQLQL